MGEPKLWKQIEIENQWKQVGEKSAAIENQKSISEIRGEKQKSISRGSRSSDGREGSKAEAVPGKDTGYSIKHGYPRTYFHTHAFETH
ncbi:hypothetical protein L1887_19023 [Cichorium endivia]|nr:hypothetical protein L1887_19023 [Cichorium endivia]